jgi:hypothetical protein
MAENRDDALEMIVESVRVQMSTGRHVLLLKEVGLGRILPIWIGPWEASAIAMRLQGVTPERPLTHDLLGSVISELGGRVERIVIVSLADETFHARLEIATAGARRDVDARPSDAIALAVRLEVPIFASPDVLDKAAKLIDLEADEDDEAELRRPCAGAAGASRERGRGRGRGIALDLPGLHQFAGPGGQGRWLERQGRRLLAGPPRWARPAPPPAPGPSADALLPPRPRSAPVGPSALLRRRGYISARGTCEILPVSRKLRAARPLGLTHDLGRERRGQAL